MKLKNCFFHGVGGHLDYSNISSSYYSNVVDEIKFGYDDVDIPLKFEIGNLTTQYDLFSLTSLEKILNMKGICSRERMNYILPITSASMNPNNTVCISKRVKNYDEIRPFPAYNFSVRSLSIVLPPDTLEYFKNSFMDFDKIRKTNPADTSVMYGEYRVFDFIPCELFQAISIPVTHISNQRFDNLRIYFSERINEVKIIRELLNQYKLDIPIVDTATGINLEKGLVKYIK